jgi:phosphatidylinositol glycan class B
MLIIKKEKFRSFLALALGVLLSIGLSVFIDHWLYDEWVLSSWNYLDQNLFHNKASQFGTEPWYYFFSEGFVQLIPPFSIVIIVCLFLFWGKFPRHWITWVTLPFLLFHIPVAHKEIRFLMPLLVFVPFMCVAVFDAISEKQNRILKFIRSNGFVKFTLTFNALALVFVCLKPADSSTQRLISIYNEVDGEQALLLFDKDNPYELGSLHYFRKATVRTDYIPENMNTLQNENVYLFSEADDQPIYKIINTKVFYKTYCNFPDWFNYLNFNGWVERAGRYSIYKRLNE